MTSTIRYATRSPTRLRNATPSLLHQRHAGRLLRPPRRDPGRGLASSRDRELHAGRCPALWARDLRDDGSWMATARAGGSEAWVDGTFRPRDRRGEEVRRIEHV